MDRPLSQALESLLPASTGSLPPELLELAVSLLAQSRGKASSLKADEEIARSYACANIACERLKQTLVLPKIQARPPCPPKVYQNLYRYLDSVLPAGTRRTARLSTSNHPTSSRYDSSAKSRTPKKQTHVNPVTPKRTTPRRQAISDRELPLWVMPTIRKLCNKMSALAAPHHIYAGVSSIVSARGLFQVKELNIPALIIAVFFLVKTRLAGVRTGPAEYAEQRSVALQIVKDAADGDVERSKVDDADVDYCTNQFKNEQWTQMDWFGNIPVGTGVGTTDSSKEIAAGGSLSNEDIEEEQILPVQKKAKGAEQGAPQCLEAGLGTMVSTVKYFDVCELMAIKMRNQVDYLSDDRRQDYEIWKRDILSQLDELQACDRMAL